MLSNLILTKPRPLIWYKYIALFYGTSMAMLQAWLPNLRQRHLFLLERRWNILALFGGEDCKG